MKRPVRVALVGIDHPHGAHWRELLRNFPNEIQMTAIVPGFGGALTSLEERYADLPRFETVDALVKGHDFDAALVCLPNDQTPEVIQKLSQTGRHLLCEKPLGRNADEAQDALRAVKDSGVAFQNGYVWRYDDAANRLKAMVAEGRFGKLFSVEMTYVTSDIVRRGPDHYLFDPSISGNGFFSWLACHHLDLLLYITGQRVVGVTARTGVFAGHEAAVEDGGAAILELSGGGLAHFIGGYWLPRWAGEMKFCFRGTERWVQWDPTRPGTGGVLEIHGPKPQWHAMEETFTLPEEKVAGYGGGRGLRLVSDWLEAIDNSAASCRNTPQSALAVLKLIDAIQESSSTQRRVSCDIGSD
ncbi:MAG: Gfo/Idh/MocA family protein [Planctomyces sp.]|jgi:predicted dehydrogenase